MTKVQQKISVSFELIDGPKIFCHVRNYLLCAQKNDVTPTAALKTFCLEEKCPKFSLMVNCYCSIP
jgi:hypothetical protein